MPRFFCLVLALSGLLPSCLLPQKRSVVAGFQKPGKPGGACGNFVQHSPELLLPGKLAPADLKFQIQADTARAKISPLIYGSNQQLDLDRNRQTLRRFGGNRFTAYNWENNASNAGKDWHYQNDAHLSASDAPAAAVLSAIREAERHGVATIVTVPIVDHVAADRRGDGDVRKSGSDYLASRFRRNKPRKAEVFASSPDPNDDSVYQDEFANFLTAALPKAQVLFSLDNEPDLWFETHPEVHPEKVSYEELVQRTIEFARSLKAAAPGREILGFGSYGWAGYTTLQDAPDRQKHAEFIDYFLDQLRAAEAAHGIRLVDYLDLHWYPEARGAKKRIVFDEALGAEVFEARVQAPRSLWDHEYEEDSWISRDAGPIRLLDRIRTKIDEHYPGTKLAIGEWNYGGNDDISGAIASADVLGIFGCRGVELAAHWPLSENEPYFDAALRAYRNYDGKGSTFGDRLAPASTSNYETSSIYASVDAAVPGRIVAVAINKLRDAQSVAIEILGKASFANAEVYKLTSRGPELMRAEPLGPIDTNSFFYEMPAASVSVLVFSGG